MNPFTVPTRDDVSPANQAIFDQMQKSFGMVPNLYATFARNESALGDYLALQNRKTTLTAKEKEVVNLIVSQVNDCAYCVPAHTTIGRMVGFTDEQLLDIRRGRAPFDAKLDALVKFTKDVAVNRGRPSAASTNAFYAAGYSQASLIDVVILIGDKVISNYLHNLTGIPVDWPAVPVLEAEAA